MLKLKTFISIFVLAIPFFTHSDELYDALIKKSNAGNAEATYHLGMLYNNGIGVAKSPTKAFELFLKAANNDDPLGHYKVGCYYAGQFGEIQGLTLSKDKSFQHKLIAAEAGYNLAQNDIASAHYQKGNIAKAIEWAEKAGNQGHVQSLSNLLSLYLAPDSEFQSNRDAYLVSLKLQKLIPKNKRLEEIKSELESKLSETEVKQADNLAATWQPQVSNLTKQAMQGINRSKSIAGITTGD
ncbi:tetratricopeptide repeat protein [Idiomarina sp. UBA3162]|uniref:tetratricopeptide repeat protein n=1 Tax=Idiomarina sp. UBA3162 TaxID=1946641 RepID=UPI000C935C7E|nr:hypothetical protein [Idiomarina sp. UBA3162]MAD54527.1 hypothetical protein [Idiomarinaceae bacterium]|tara:strand:- start:3952 stop:4671 length:720 start_codon:yes stop_codon:yes gene_type:complete